MGTDQLVEKYEIKEHRTSTSPMGFVGAKTAPLSVLSYNVRRGIAQPHKDWRALQVLILAAATASSLVINGYYNPSRVHQQKASSSSLMSPSSSMLHVVEECLGTFQIQRPQDQQSIRLPSFIRDPSPEQLLAACLAYGMAMNCYYHLHKDDRYQFLFAGGGAVNAFVVGWASGKDIHGILMDFMPWFLILSLVLSATLHNMRLENGPRCASETIAVAEEAAVFPLRTS